MIRRVLLVVVLVAGCKAKSGEGADKPPSAHDVGSAAPKPAAEPAIKVAPEKIASAVEDFDAMRQRMCACKDAACAAKVSDDWRAFTETGVVREVSDAQLDKMGPIEIELNDCKAKLIPRDKW
ncbi:MAG TPA: hypothetical protein VGM39_05865 [Kofleriaceae bacterium]